MRRFEWPEFVDTTSWSYANLIGQPKEHAPGIAPRSVSATTNVNPLDDVVFVSGNSTLTLETAVGADDRKHTFIKTDSGTTMTIAATGSETIDGAATIATAVQYAEIRVVSNGTNWNAERLDLANSVGTLAVAHGGTGDITLTAHGVMLGEGTNAVAVTAAMTDGQLLVGQTGVDPLPKTLSSDATLAASGALTIANDAVSFAKMQNIATDSLIGRDTAATGDPENILLNATLSMDGAGNLQRAALSGDISATAGSNTTTLATVNTNVGTFGSSTAVAQVTVNGKGLTTAASAVNIVYDSANFTGTNWTDLTDGGTTTLHTHTSGVASSVTLVDAAADTTTWVVLGTNQTGNVSPATDAGLTYDASANNLTTTTFTGALAGNATTATSAVTVTDATQAAITSAANLATVGTITSGTWSATAIAANKVVAGTASSGSWDVASGGSGRATGTTAYALVATGTTATGAQQTLAAGATTEILVGGGVAALPVWTTATGTGAPVRAGTPSLTTPDIGAATGASVALTALSKINANAAALPAGPTGTLFQIGNADAVNTRALIDAFGAAQASLTFRRADTSAASPSAIQSAENIGGLFWSGYGASAYADAKARLVCLATEAWSNTANGTKILIGTTPNTTTTLTTAVTIDQDQSVTLAATIATAAPTGGAGAWKLGIANSVSPTSPNRTVTIDIGGTTYYLAAKTTND